MAGEFAVATGPIRGRIPHGKGFVDVTADYVFVDSEEEAKALADSIELEHAHRNTHPVQGECTFLGPLNQALQSGDKAEARRMQTEMGVHDAATVIERHQAAHKALNEKAGL